MLHVLKIAVILGNLITDWGSPADWWAVRAQLILTLPCVVASHDDPSPWSHHNHQVTRGDHCSVRSSHHYCDLICHHDHDSPDQDSDTSVCWHIAWHMSSSVMVSPCVFVSDHCNHRVISPRNCAVLSLSLSLPYLHPISPNNGKCVSCRVASSRCPCVFSYSVNVGQTAFTANNSPWNSVTFELPRYLIPSSLSVLFVLRPQNANDIRYKWSICIESEW